MGGSGIPLLTLPIPSIPSRTVLGDIVRAVTQSLVPGPWLHQVHRINVNHNRPLRDLLAIHHRQHLPQR